MTTQNKSWNYDAASRTVMNDAGNDVICIVPKRQPLAIGQLLAAAPAMTTLALDLHSHLSDSLDAWEGEEDSVQEEHADLIADLTAANARADAVLNGPTAAVSLTGDMLRAMAASLLERAHQADGLQPYVVTHSHRHGDTTYTMWSVGVPTEKQVVAALDIDFEPEREESIECHPMSIGEMVGVQDSRQAPDSDDEDEDADLGYGPASM